jgi:hypothetical protein
VQARTLGGPSAALLTITATWTGGRWRELTGLQRHHVDTDSSAEKVIERIDSSRFPPPTWTDTGINTPQMINGHIEQPSHEA